MTIAEAKSQVLQSIRAGEHEMECGYPYPNDLNDRQRQVIQAFHETYGECWLGQVNRPDRSGPPLYPWDAGLVYNFGASFVLPCFDEELSALLLERETAEYTGTREDYRRIKAIYERIDALKGEPLIWN